MRMPLLLGFSIPVTLVVVLIYGGMAYSPQKRMEYPPQYGLNDRIEAAREMMNIRMHGAGPTTGIPELEITHTVHDFGVMPLERVGSTTFHVRSVGTGRVDLMDGGKSCQCVGFKISDRQLEPGETAEITIEWRTSEATDAYLQNVVLKTNCEAVPELRLEVIGRVTETFSVQPSAVVIGRLLPVDTEAEGHAWLYSHEWDEITELDVSISDARFEVALDDELEGAPEGLVGKWVRRLSVRTPADLESGHLSAVVTVTGKGTDGTPVRLTIPLEGHVTRRLSIIGNSIDANGLIEMGTLSPFQGASRVMTIRVNDEDTRLSLKQVTCDQDCIEVEMEPINGAEGLYRLTVRVPEDRPDGAHAGTEAAKLKLEFDHPRVEPVELRVSYVALSRLGR